MNISVQTNIEAFNSAVAEYIDVSGKVPADAVVKHSKEFANRLRADLKRMMPAKGSIRSARMDKLKAGGPKSGVKVRDAVLARVLTQRGIAQDIKSRAYVFGKKGSKFKRIGGKKLNWWQQAIRAELNVREKGRGYLSYSAAFSRLLNSFGQGQTTDSGYVVNRYNRGVSKASFVNQPSETSNTFNWGNTRASKGPAIVLNQPRGQAAISNALAGARANMMEYVNRKHSENAAATLGRVR